MRKGKKENRMTAILSLGLVITLFCLAVCVSLVGRLDNSYTNEVSNDFHTHHTTLTKVMNRRISEIVDVANMVSEVIDTTKHNFDVDRVKEVMTSYSQAFDVSEINFMDTDGRVLCVHSDCYYVDNTQVLRDYMGNFTKEQGSYYLTVILGENAKDGSVSSRLMCQVPLYYCNSFKGYIIVSRDITELFERDDFDYIDENGESYIVDLNGNILVRSTDARISQEMGANLFKEIINYSDGKNDTRVMVEKLERSIAEGGSGYVNLTTSEGYGLQVSYDSIAYASGMYFVSCFDDNVVQDKVQPLIYRSVLSCMLIMLLMIGVIVYVWATAKRDNLTIEKLAYEDHVTKGKNINFFKEFVPMVRAVYKETPFVIRRFDISNFRYINEAYGHERADGVLTSCINCFAEIFSEKELCVRMNADQFIAFIENNQEAESKLIQYEKKVNEEARGQGIKYPIKFKAGIYQIRKHDSDIDIMIDHANVARKTVKGDEKNLGAYYSDKVIMDMRKIDRIESDMQRALATNEFKVFIQGKWDINEDVVCGGEALVRWIKSDGTMVYPDEFIPIFENNGFVEKLDFYMLEMVCEKIRELLDAGCTVYPISVNQSRLLLHSPEYVKNVSKIIKQYNIPANCIELEITETVFMDDLDNMIKTVKALKDIGVRLAMDDFGSGYSSLNMLKDVPFDIIKIDREFFNESVAGESSGWILQKIVEMVNGLGMESICEGVETIEQVRLLRNIGCNKVQGYLYSMPMPFEQFIEKYCQNNEGGVISE